jgi:hypothetical protein
VIDRSFVLKWAHMGLGTRHPKVVEEHRRVREEHIAEMEAEQEKLNAAMPTCRRAI